MMDFLRRLERSAGEDSLVGLRAGAPESASTSGHQATWSTLAEPLHTRHRIGRGRARPRESRAPHVDRHARQPIEGIIHQIFANLTGGGGFIAGQGLPVFVNLHGNPGDYAWGRGGLDAVITQLLNQLDGTGPPPLPREKIAEIPTVHIEQDQVDKLLQCTVCMEDFRPQEPVKKLSCQHHFHPDCIIPWLELHGTCPICRKLLNDEASDATMGTPSAAGSASVNPVPTAPELESSSLGSLSTFLQAQSDSLHPSRTNAGRTFLGSQSRARHNSVAGTSSSPAPRPQNPPANDSVYDFSEDCD
ncbi:E3 ubiquitin-protein ligase RNF115-like isoform X2 [Ornithodoros turicata]